MNPFFQRLMRQATRLTQGGQLREATRVIQHALGGAMPHPAAPAPAPAPTPAPSVASPTGSAANDDALVIDVPSRFVEPPPVQADDKPSEPGTEQWTDGIFEHPVRALAYNLFVPARGAGTARPLLLMLHGCTQDPEDFAAGTRMNELARTQGFLVVYPQQTKEANASKCWNWFQPQDQQRDSGEPALLAALTRSVMAAQAVDPARVYVAGLSAGGAMADILAHSHPDLFAAVGVHSGLPSGAASSLMAALVAMKNGRAPGSAKGDALPTIVFHGDADKTVHPRNGEQVIAAALAGQAGGVPSSSASNGESPQGRGYTRRDYVDAQGRPFAEHWLLHGAGHAWAGGSASGSFTDPSGPDASAEMLRFFLAHPRTSMLQGGPA